MSFSACCFMAFTSLGCECPKAFTAMRKKVVVLFSVYVPKVDSFSVEKHTGVLFPNVFMKYFLSRLIISSNCIDNPPDKNNIYNYT